jgi:hypothetical protein
MAYGLFNLPNDVSSLQLSMIHMIKLRPGKGLLLINAYNKPIESVPVDNDELAKLYKVAIEEQMRAGRNWTQPDWRAIREEFETRPTVNRPGSLPN